MPERTQFSSFGDSGFSVEDAESVNIVDNFLSSDPTAVTEIGAEQQEELKKTPPKKPEATDPKEKPKPAIPEKKPVLSADDLFAEAAPEEGTEEEKEETEEEKKPEVKKDEDESPYSVLTKELLTLGVFTPDEDEDGNDITPEIKSGDDFLKHFRNEVKKQAGNSVGKFLEQFGPDYAEMFDAVFVNGVPPYEYISRQAKIENIEDYDISTEDNQEKIVRQWYKDQEIPQERIESKILKLKNYADLEEEAGVAKSVLIEKEKKNLQTLAQQKQNEIATKNKIKQDYISNVEKLLTDKLKDKDFDGIPVDKKFTEQTYAYLTKDAYKTKNNELLTEFDKDILDLNRPENNGRKVKLAMLLQILKVDPTLSRLGKRAVSKESNKIFQDLEKRMGKSRPAVADKSELTPF